VSTTTSEGLHGSVEDFFSVVGFVPIHYYAIWLPYR
jgi:hypothetical protein